MNREVIFYDTESGKIPVRDFLDSFKINAAKKVLWTLQLIKETDRIPKTYFKKIRGSEEIWEVRIKYASNSYRIFSFWDENNLIILTHGIIKKTQKIPAKEMMLAEKYRKDYFRRKR